MSHAKEPQAEKPLSCPPNKIAEHGGLDYDLCPRCFRRMAEGGEIEKGGRGKYRLTPDSFAY